MKSRQVAILGDHPSRPYFDQSRSYLTRPLIVQGFGFYYNPTGVNKWKSLFYNVMERYNLHDIVAFGTAGRAVARWWMVMLSLSCISFTPCHIEKEIHMIHYTLFSRSLQTLFYTEALLNGFVLHWISIREESRHIQPATSHPMTDPGAFFCGLRSGLMSSHDIKVLYKPWSETPDFI